MKFASTIILGASLLSLVSCGNKSSDSVAPKKATPKPIVSETSFYKAVFAPINAHLAGDVSGEAIIKNKGGIFTVQVRVSGAPAQIVHAQRIHLARECPVLADDTNKDGIIDSAEGARSYGSAMIALDANLASKAMEAFPTADFSGNYYYGQNVSTKILTNDQKIADLDMTGHQIVIYGIAAETALPATVAKPKVGTAHEALPIACGTFAKIDALEEGNNSNGRKD